MHDPISKDSKPPLDSECVAEMEKYGITKKSIDYFFCGEYRYTKFLDALAQAKRIAGEG